MSGGESLVGAASRPLAGVDHRAARQRRAAGDRSSTGHAAVCVDRPAGLDVRQPCRPSSSALAAAGRAVFPARSEEHTSELQSLMRISYAVFCLKKKKNKKKKSKNETYTSNTCRKHKTVTRN